MSKRILCVDFDGVIHGYTSGWKGPDVIPDPPVPGAINWLDEMLHLGWDVQIYSSRSRQGGGIAAMKSWLIAHAERGFDPERLGWPTQKPAAYLTIDDRAICFQGSFPSTEELEAFTPWNKRTHGIKPAPTTEEK